MSVINQMLRDLDARAASEGERAGLPPHLRTLPPSTKLQRQNWHMLAIGVAIGAAVAGVAVALLMPQAPAPASAPVSAPPPAAPAAPAVPAAPHNAAPEGVPPASTSGVAPDKSAKSADENEMKLSTLLTLAQQSVPEKPAVAKVVPPVAPPAPAVAAPKAPSSSPAPAAPKPVEAARPAVAAPAAKPAAPARNEAAADMQIDKRPKGGTSSDAVEAEYRKGMQAVKRGDNAAGVLAFQRALELDPGMTKARQALLSVLVGGRQWSDAQRIAQAGLALDPAQSGWAMILARLQFEQGDAAGAVDTLGRHAAHAQGDADYQGLFAYLLQKQQRPAEAAERFKAALALRPNEGRWWFGLGLALEGAGRGSEAREAYLKARDSGNLPGDMGAVVEQKLH